MRAQNATFVTSATAPAHFPPPSLPEIAFAGRSNVGKSSLINKLVGVPKLARTSSTPGRTRLINWFRVVPAKGQPVMFVDLPGYGYAKVSRSMRESWRPLIESYLAKRSPLRGLVLLVDARRGAEDEEVELMEWLATNDIAVLPVLTKIDKLPKNKRKPAGFALERALSSHRGATRASARAPILVSAHTGEGLIDLWRGIASVMEPAQKSRDP